MPLSSLIFLFLFLFLSIGSLINPMLGAIGYIGHYHIFPERQWWGEALQNLGIRYSYTIAIFFTIGTIFKIRKLKFKKLFHSQEILLIIFLIIIWSSKYLGLEVDENYDPFNYPPIKISKVTLFVLLLTHVVSDFKKYKMITWTFVLMGLYLGYTSYTAPASAFFTGRLTTIGGPDFNEANSLAAHFIAILPFVAILLLTGKWKQKVIAIITSIFVVNGIILTQSRGALVGALVGIIFTIFWAAPRYRKKILIFLIIGLIGAFSLTNQTFWQRMGTIQADVEDERDSSAQSRIEIWGIAIKMMNARPQGFGAGNFMKYMGDYNDIYVQMDAHNTFLRCGAELGYHGLIIFIMMIINAFLILRRIRKQASIKNDKGQFIIYAYALQLTIIVYFSSGMFISSIYHEETFWFLLLPVCLERAFENNGQVGKEHNVSIDQNINKIYK